MRTLVLVLLLAARSACAAEESDTLSIGSGDDEISFNVNAPTRWVLVTPRGEVVVDTATGTVTIPDDLPLDKASRAFWAALARMGQKLRRTCPPCPDIVVAPQPSAPPCSLRASFASTTFP